MKKLSLTKTKALIPVCLAPCGARLFCYYIAYYDVHSYVYATTDIALPCPPCT